MSTHQGRLHAEANNLARLRTSGMMMMAALFHPALLGAVLLGMILKFVDFVVATPLWVWALWLVATGVACILAGRSLRPQPAHVRR